jgi:alpha-tubulin suppressor-like RCC1 family protein
VGRRPPPASCRHANLPAVGPSWARSADVVGSRWTLCLCVAAMVFVGCAGGQGARTALNATSVSAGQEFSCASEVTGSVFCWAGKPMKVSGVDGALSVASGARTACAVVKDGTVKCWVVRLGDSLEAEGFGVAETIVGVSGATSVAVGAGRACAVSEAGRVQCWSVEGDIGSDAFSAGQPVTVENVDDATSVSVGIGHACALRRSGRVSCWGNGAFGALGNGVSKDRADGQEVLGLDGAVAIAAGRLHSCATLKDGQVKCWGANSSFQVSPELPAESSVGTPVVVGQIDHARMVAAGSTQTCAVDETGGIRCWGSNAYGVFGDGTYANPGGPTMEVGRVKGVSTAVSVSIGQNDHACALLSDRTVVCWGNNVDGQLGDGSRRGSGLAIAVHV